MKIREMRKKDREIFGQEIDKIFSESSYGVLSTNSEDGYAYGIPLNYVFLDGNIYFHCAFSGHKIDNINFNDKASFVVVDKAEIVGEKFTTKYKSAVAFGRVSKVVDSEKEKILIAFIEKYSIEFYQKGIEYVKRVASETNVLKLKIEHRKGKAS